MATAVVLARCSAPERMRSIADSRAVGGTHNTGCRARFSMFSSRGRRPPCLLLLHAPGTTGAPESPSARDWRMSTGLGQPMIEVVGENEEGIAGLAAVRGTVHDRECGRLERSEAADGGRRLGRETACAEHVLGLNGSTDEVVPRQRRPVSYLGEKVTAEQGAGGLLVELSLIHISEPTRLGM